MFLNLILPIFGLLIIVFTIGAYVFDYGKNYREANQKFNGLGLDVQVSVITIYIVLGLIFCGAGIFLSTRNYESKYNAIRVERNTLKRQLLTSALNFSNALESFKSKDITYGFTLDASFYQNQFPSPDSLTCIYYDNWERRQCTVYAVAAGPEKGSYQVTIKHLIETEVSNNQPVLVVKDKKSNVQWVCNAFNPLHPTITLQRQ